MFTKFAVLMFALCYIDTIVTWLSFRKGCDCKGFLGMKMKGKVKQKGRGGFLDFLD